jgi:hypothetical protein
VYAKPAGLVLVKGDPAQGKGNEIFGIWPTGFTRQITSAEHALWGFPEADHQIAYGDDATFNQFVAYDKALRA